MAETYELRNNVELLPRPREALPQSKRVPKRRVVGE
jgi:hypothetical protein